MSEHVIAWLGTYHDGELSGRRLRRVEAHLAHCATCRAELESLEALTALLQQVAAPKSPTPPERFVAQVGLCLPQRPTQPTWQRALETGWRLTPLGLAGAWVVGQAVFVMAALVLGALRLGLGGSALASSLPAWASRPDLFEGWDLTGASLSDADQIVRQLLSHGGPLGWTITLYLVFLVVIALLYWSWLASWWVYGQRRQRDEEK